MYTYERSRDCGTIKGYQIPGFPRFTKKNPQIWAMPSPHAILTAHELAFVGIREGKRGTVKYTFSSNEPQYIPVSFGVAIMRQIVDFH